MIAAKAACAAASSAVVGSSSSQSGPMRDEETGERDASLLPGRERAHGKVERHGRGRPGRERRGSAAADESPPSAPAQKARFSAARQRAFQRVGMAEIMRLLADRALRVAALERKAPGLQRKETAERPQQARLAGPVRPGHDQRRALLRPRTKALRTAAARRARSPSPTREGAWHPLRTPRRRARLRP